MWSHSNGLNHFTDCAGFYQFARFNSCPVFKPFAVHDRVNAFGFFLNTANSCQLFKRGDARFVDQIIFSMLHYPYTQRCPFIGNSRTEYELYRIVFQDFFFTCRQLYSGNFLVNSVINSGSFAYKRTNSPPPLMTASVIEKI